MSRQSHTAAEIKTYQLDWRAHTHLGMGESYGHGFLGIDRYNSLTGLVFVRNRC